MKTKNKIKNEFFLLFVLFAMVRLAPADVLIWTAATGDYGAGANWGGSTPVSGDELRISNGGTAQIALGNTYVGGKVLLGRGASGVGNLSMSGGTLTLDVAPSLSVADGSGSSSTVDMEGSSALNASGNILVGARGAGVKLMDGDSLIGTFANVNIIGGAGSESIVYDRDNGSLLLKSPAVAGVHQRVVEWVDRLPNQPPTYDMRDWKKVARDLDALMFDWNASGAEELPLISLYENQYNYSWDSFEFGSYVGTPNGNGMGPRAMVNGVLVGVDKSNQDGHDYFVEVQQYYNKRNGYNIYSEDINDNGGAAGGNVKFYLWAHNNLSFYELYDRNRDVVNFTEQFAGVANAWYDILGNIMGGLSNDRITFSGIGGVNLDTMETYEGQCWEDTSAAFAYLQYMAWRELGDAKYLDGVDWCMDYLLRQNVSPLYSFHMSYAPYLAARRNMEADDRRYDEHKLVTWCFEPDPLGVHEMYGMHLGVWSNAAVQPYGLIGGVNDNGVPDKALPPGTFNTALNMKALVRYDDRYARIAGKWLLHAANSARLYYANSMDGNHQQPFDKLWADRFDPEYCLSYEQVQEFKTLYQFPVEDLPAFGTVSGDVSGLDGSGETYQTLTEVDVDGADGLEHTWRIPCDTATSRQLAVMATIVDGGDADFAFNVYYALDAPTNYTRVFQLTSTNANAMRIGDIPGGDATDIYVKVEDKNRVDGNSGHDSLLVDCVYVRMADTNISPYMAGPYRSFKEPLDRVAKSARNFALYLAIDVGRLAAGFGFTDVEQILSWDLNAADFFKDPCYPMHLYYNPYSHAMNIHVDVGTESVNLYDTVCDSFLAFGVSGLTPIEIPADCARIVVRTPADGAIRHSVPYRMECGGVMVDYLATRGEVLHESFENGWPDGAIVASASLTAADAYDSGYSIELDGQDSVTIPIVATGLTRLEVAYARRITGATTNDEFFCEFYDGQTWQELERYEGVERAPGTTWKMKYVDLPESADDSATFHLRFRVDYSQGHANVDLLTIMASATAEASGFAAWQRNHFTSDEIVADLAGRESDFDGDGIDNECEYYFGLDPRSPLNPRQPALSIVSEVSNDYPAVTYTRRNDDGHLAYAVQVSHSLGEEWMVAVRDDDGKNEHSYTVVDGPNDNLDETETLTFRYNTPFADLDDPVFFRIVTGFEPVD